MEYKVTYEPDNSRGFKDESHLRNFLNVIFRTDIEQKHTSPLTRGNIYCVRGEDGNLEYFCNVNTVGARIALKKKAMVLIKDLPVSSLRQDAVYIEPNIPIGECLEFMSDLIEERLPRQWEDDSHVPGTAANFLSSSVCFAFYVDQSYDGDTLQFKIHRLYIK